MTLKRVVLFGALYQIVGECDLTRLDYILTYLRSSAQASIFPDSFQAIMSSHYNNCGFLFYFRVSVSDEADTGLSPGQH